MHLVNLGILVDHQLVEAEPHVKNDDFLSAADGGHVPPDLVISAYGYYFYFHCFSCFLISLCEFFPEKFRFSDVYESSHDPPFISFVRQRGTENRSGGCLSWFIRPKVEFLFFPPGIGSFRSVKHGFARTLSRPGSAGRYRCLSLQDLGLLHFPVLPPMTSVCFELQEGYQEQF
jgi:hypothetical protein